MGHIRISNSAAVGKRTKPSVPPEQFDDSDTEGIYPSHVATVGGGGAAAVLRGVVDDDAAGEGAELDSQL